MSLPFTSKLLRCLFPSQDENVDVKQVAATTAHQCVDKIVKRFGQDSEALSAAQLKGYLRAIAIPMIDTTIEETLSRHRRLRRFAAEIRLLTLEVLEQLVLQKLEKTAVTLPARAAA